MHRVMMAGWAVAALVAIYFLAWNPDWPSAAVGGLAGVWSLSFVQRIFGEQ